MLWFCCCREVKSPAVHWNGCLLPVIITQTSGLPTPWYYWNSNRHMTGCRSWGSAEMERSLKQGITCGIRVAELSWACPCHAAECCADASVGFLLGLSRVTCSRSPFQSRFLFFVTSDKPDTKRCLFTVLTATDWFWSMTASFKFNCSASFLHINLIL